MFSKTKRRLVFTRPINQTGLHGSAIIDARGKEALITRCSWDLSPKRPGSPVGGKECCGAHSDFLERRLNKAFVFDKASPFTGVRSV